MLQGFAVGVLGMSVGDFEALDTDEFAAISKAWSEHTDTMRRDAWERSRAVGWLSVTPYAKKGTSALTVFPLPWDKKESPRNSEAQNRANIAALAALVGKHE